jgi:hypothetical protein
LKSPLAILLVAATSLLVGPVIERVIRRANTTRISYRGDGQADQQRARRIGQCLGIGAGLFGQLRLEVDERTDILWCIR